MIYTYIYVGGIMLKLERSFDILLTVHLSIILAIVQLNAQILVL